MTQIVEKEVKDFAKAHPELTAVINRCENDYNVAFYKSEEITYPAGNDVWNAAITNSYWQYTLVKEFPYILDENNNHLLFPPESFNNEPSGGWNVVLEGFTNNLEESNPCIKCSNLVCDKVTDLPRTAGIVRHIKKNLTETFRTFNEHN